MSNDKTHAEMVAEVAANYTREACTATQGVIEAVRDTPLGPVYSETPETRARIEALMAENYKLVTKVSELQVAIEFLRSQKP